MELSEDDTFEALRKPLTEDEKEFGRKKWIYCDQHLRPHTTGWCTVPNRNKIKLDADNYTDAAAECVKHGYTIFKG